MLDWVDFKNLKINLELTQEVLLRCPFDGSMYSITERGNVCQFCLTCEIGRECPRFSNKTNFNSRLIWFWLTN